MSQRGNLSKIDFGKLLMYINQNKLSGTLRISQGEKSKFLVIENGEITSAYSEFVEDSFRSVIRRMQLLPDAKQFDLDMEDNLSDSQFARVILEKGYVTEREFLEVIKRQCWDIILSLFEWRNGDFIFYQEKFPENKSITLKLPYTSIIERGQERNRLRREIDLKLPASGLYKFKDDSVRKQQIDVCRDLEFRLCLTALDEPLPIQGLIKKTGCTEFTVVSFLLMFFQRNFLEIIETKLDVLSDDVMRILAEAEILFAKSKYWDAWMRVKKVVEENPSHQEIQQIYKTYTEKFKEDLRATIKSTDQIPQIITTLDENLYKKFPKDTAIGYLLSRIDGKSSIKDLGRLLNLDREKHLVTMYLMIKANIVSLTTQKPLDLEEIQKKRRSIRQIFEKMQQQTYYEMLGINPDADDTQIKNAYFKMAKLYHPDARSDEDPNDIKEKQDEIFVKIRDAYQTLMDQTKRKSYDNQIGLGATSPDAEIVKTKTKAQLQFSVGMRSLQSREYRTAMEFFRSAIDLDPYEPKYYAKLSEVCTKNPRWYRAGILACRRAIQIEPENPTYYSILGTLYKLEGDFVESEQQFQKVLQLDPENLTARQELASMGKQISKETGSPRKDTQHTPMLRNDKKEEKK